jgi:hypothetical protein
VLKKKKKTSCLCPWKRNPGTVTMMWPMQDVIHPVLMFWVTSPLHSL